MDLSQQDLDNVARTMVSEAGEYGDDGLASVAQVVRNRSLSGGYGDTPSAVVLSPGQFSAWGLSKKNPNNNYPGNIKSNDPQYLRARAIAQAVFNGEWPDATRGAVDYYDAKVLPKPPSWARGRDPIAQVGGHVFYGPQGPPSAQPDLLGSWGAQPATSAPASAAAPGEDLLGSWSTGAPAEASTPVPWQRPDLPHLVVPSQNQPLPATTQADVSGASGTPSVPGGTTQGYERQVVEGMPIIGPLMNKAVAATGAAIQPLFGKGTDQTFGQRYSANLGDIQSGNEAFAAANPAGSTAANVLGATLATVPAAATAVGGRMLGTVGATLGSRFYGGLLGGGAIGMADAALRGENPIEGGGIGAVGGGAGVLGGEALGRLYGLGANLLASRGAPLNNVNSVARDWLTNAMANETPASLAAARQRMGPIGFAADINPAMTELAAGLANSAEPPASTLIGEAYRTRQAGQRQTVENAITTALGPRQNLADVTRAERQARSAAADPLYDAWRNTPVQPTDELKELGTQLEEDGFFRDANRLLRADNRPTYQNFFTPGERKAWPTAEAWDYVKQAIDGRIRANIPTATAPGNPNEVRVYTGLKNRLIDAIDNHPNPNVAGVWRAAREAWANPTAIMSAREAGQDVWRSAQRPDELGYQLTDYSAPERAAFREGARDSLATLMDASRRGDTTARNRLLAPVNQEKLLWLSPNGPTNADRLVNTLEQQEYLGGQAQYVNPRAGSPTAPRTAARNALQAPTVGQWNPNLTQPLSWIPPSWIDAFRPTTILQGGREASYAAARQQLAPILLTQGDRGLNALLSATVRENTIRAAAADRAAAANRAITAAIAGPVSSEVRRKANAAY